MLTNVIKFPVSFHLGKFLAGTVLLVTGLLFGLLRATEPEDDQGLFLMGVAMAATIILGGCVFIRNSLLPWCGSYFAWPLNPPSKRGTRRITRNKIGVLDVLLMLAALSMIVLMFGTMWPKAATWQVMAFVVSGPAMFLMSLIWYGAQFMPDRAWIDKIVQTVSFIVAIIFCLTLRLQPI